MGECSFWYRPTRVVPDQRPLNGRRCCCCCCIINMQWIHCIPQGSFPVRKRTRTPKIWRAREREPIWGSGGRAPGQGAKPPEAEGILLPKRALCHSHLLNFAAICRKGPERHSGDQKKEQEWRSGAFRLETNPGIPSDSEKCHD